MNKNTIVLATKNAGKIHELQLLLAASGFIVAPQSDYQIPEAVENGSGFIENALIKARNASRYSGLPAIADDSGIAVDALNGSPGIHSARYAGKHANDGENLRQLLGNMENVIEKNRTARFICLMVYVRHAEDPTPIICQGEWRGHILRKPAGNNGFGYDPVFYIAEKGRTSAQLNSDEKNAMSHRGKASRCLVKQLQDML